MSKLRFVTLTGAGQDTDIPKMEALAKKYPFVEWGILYSEDRAGKENKYPSLAWISQLVPRAALAGMSVSLHLCGKIVRDLLTYAIERGNNSVTGPKSKMVSLVALLCRIPRIQLNIRAQVDDLLGFESLVQLLREQASLQSIDSPVLILQWNATNEKVCKLLGLDSIQNLLVDSSGGNGIERTDWPTSGYPNNLRQPGYAGGLGPDNLQQQLPKIVEAAGTRPYWIDMEGKIRDEADQMDLEKCERVLSTTAEFLKSVSLKDGAL